MWSGKLDVALELFLQPGHEPGHLCRVRHPHSVGDRDFPDSHPCERPRELGDAIFGSGALKRAGERDADGNFCRNIALGRDLDDRLALSYRIVDGHAHVSLVEGLAGADDEADPVDVFFGGELRAPGVGNEDRVAYTFRSLNLLQYFARVGHLGDGFGTGERGRLDFADSRPGDRIDDAGSSNPSG